jgi:predicted ATPase
MTQSHGQSTMSYFKARYQIEGLYLLDEPETALSAKTQIEFLQILVEASRAGHAQFVMATHSPILLACPGAIIFSFDQAPIRPARYEATEHYRIYRLFMENREQYLSTL